VSRHLRKGLGGRRTARTGGGVLIVGVGNELLGDEGLGVHVARSLARRRRSLPASVEIVDAGVALLDVIGDFAGFSRIIIVDAMCAGGRAGAVYRLELDRRLLAERGPTPVSLHQLGVDETLRVANLAGLLPGRITVLGAEPERIAPGIGLSPRLLRAKHRIMALLQAELGSRKARVHCLWGRLPRRTRRTASSRAPGRSATWPRRSRLSANWIASLGPARRPGPRHPGVI